VVYQTSLKAFKVAHAKTITARNRLLLMYQKVTQMFIYISLSQILTFWIQFGCTVLLDRVWDVDKLVNCSRTFRPLLGQMIANNEDPRHSEARQSIANARCSNQEFLRSMLHNFADSSVIVYFDHFISSCPSDQNTITL
jgi:hypothetical protein